MNADVVVIGAGFAGLSAAVRLAAAGRRVVVVEEAPRLGGRATAFTDRETGERVDNGQHVLFGCYRETYAFLEQLGTATLAPLQPRLSLAFADTSGRLTELECPNWRPPLHLVGGILRWKGLPLRDRLSAFRLARVLLAARRRGAAAVAAAVSGNDTVETWLSRHGQSEMLRTWLWRPLAVAALNQSTTVAAARPFVRVLGEMFGPRPSDSAVGLPIVPLDELFAEPARRFLAARGGEVITRSSARMELAGDGSVRAIRAGTTTIETRIVVSAVPWHALGRLFETGPPPAIAPVVDAMRALGSAPIVSVNFWFDDAISGDRFVGLIGGPFHWLFDKDLILNDRRQARRHVAIVASDAAALVDLQNADISKLALDQLRRTLPRAAAQTPQRSVVVREHRATFSVAPGGPARPGTTTAIAGFYLAGDWIDTGLPGTIESAVVSGHRAADAILRPGAPR